jgi:hypothetical protein
MKLKVSKLQSPAEAAAAKIGCPTMLLEEMHKLQGTDSI